jgi:hypothetical protein
MKKCYIAGKIGDLPLEEFTRNFNIGKMEVTEAGWDPVSPIDLPHDHDQTWASYMKEDLKHMMKCEAVYALRNWRHSPGAIVEVELAMKLGLTIIFQTDKPKPKIKDRA